jgi:hypothetical protein
MTAAALAFPAASLPVAPPAVPKKRGPKTPEGKARSRMNALKHGLRAQEFGLLPEESRAEWAEHLADLRHSLAPEDPAEEKLVTALAVAMWNEIRADRTLVETMAAIPPKRAGRSHGTDMHDPDHARSLGTAIRYMTAAGMATQRAQRAFLAHRKAKAARLILPVAEPVREECTNELPPPALVVPPSPGAATVAAAIRPATTECTNDFPRPALAWRGPGARAGSTSPARHGGAADPIPVRHGDVPGGDG